jgi:peptidyl-prolyl cis-trans isomerase SurA
MIRNLRSIFLASLSLLISTPLFATPQEINSVAAVVGTQVISRSTLEDKIGVVTEQLRQQKIAVPPANTLSGQVLQMLINQSLENQLAKRMQISATDADVQHAIKNIAAGQQLTPIQMRARLKKQGVNEAQFISQIKQQIVIQKLLQQALATQITVTPQEIAAGMKLAQSSEGQNSQYNLLHILVALPDSPTPAQIASAKQKAQNIEQQLQKGASFKSVAAAQSSDAQMFKGGDMGWKTLNELPSVFADALTQLHKGQVSAPIQTANGFHILKLVGIRGNQQQIPPAQLRQRVQEMIFQRKMAEKQQDWLNQLRATSYVKIYYQPKTLPSPNL